MRAAIFYTPAPGSALAELAAGWLGRDAFTGAAASQDPKRVPIVAEPARYGFHATLKAPFRLAVGADIATVAGRLQAFCAERAAPTIRRLTLAQLGPFFALVPAEPEPAKPEPALATLEADALRAFEPYRAPLDAGEIARRRPDRLTLRQLEHLHRWGYPFVLDAFRFHMTLTGSLHEGQQAVRRNLEAHFADVLGRPLTLDGLGLFVEPEPGAPFRVHAYHPFGPPSIFPAAPPSAAVP